MSASPAPETSAAGPPAAEPRGRARLGAYAWWQLRDYLLNKGIGTVLVLGLMLFLSWTAIGEARAEYGVASARLLVPTLFAQFVDKLVLFGVLFATNGIVSEDRKFGYYRFYFSKPVTAAAFYGQKFVVHLAGLLLIAGVMLGVHALVIEPLYPRAYFPVVAMSVLGLAGIGFLISALFTFDWISLFAIYGAAFVGWTLYGHDPGLRGLLVHALPPVHELLGVYTAIATGAAVPMRPLWWIFLYGLACLAVGLVVISRRRLATT